MMRNDGTGEFSYWKRPWHKWIVLAASLLQLPVLWMNLLDYRQVAAAGIFSPPELTKYTAQVCLQCGSNGLLAAGFLGIFLIGVGARTKQSARRAEGLLYLLLAAGWAAAGTALHQLSLSGRGLWWTGTLIVLLGCGIYDLLTYKKAA